MKKGKLERQKRLMTLISSDPSLLIRDLAISLEVSRETVRRDLDELSREGRLHRRYGGATFAPIGQTTSYILRSSVMVEERKLIAREAAKSILDNEVVMLGSGATCQQFAQELVQQDKSLTVITNSIAAALELGKSDTIRVIMAPGEYCSEENFTWGHEATDFIRKFHADIVVFSAEGVSAAGVMEIDSRASWILRQMIETARRKMLLVDHSKHHQRSLEYVCKLHELDEIITDQLPTNDLLREIRSSGVKLRCTKPGGGAASANEKNGA